jgi:hypothetical protein
VVLVEANGDRILGFTMIGSEAGEVMAMVQTAMLAGLPHTRLRDAIIAHPTMAEGLTTLFDLCAPRQICPDRRVRLDIPRPSGFRPRRADGRR